jgi:formamidopyrimidine-DNA glycosylase
MPELPELEVIREVLTRQVVGQTLQAVKVLPPGGLIVVRDLTHTGFESALTGRTIAGVARRGKFLLFTFRPGPSLPGQFLVINPKLSGRLQLAAPPDKRLAKTQLLFTFSDQLQLRYVDQKQMGQVYLTHTLESIPDYGTLGPEPFDLPLEQFRERLKKHHGEIKGILTRGDFVAGIGNAYADEILWAARLHPYRKRTQLTAEEVERLYTAMQYTLSAAIEKVRQGMQENIHLEPRAFMSVHMKAGQPCPRCGARISLVGANQRITNFCRTCQPGGLIKGME